MKIILSLFWSFLKIGLFTFGGGYAMIPLIEREVIDRRGWVRRGEFLDLLTLAQSAPGPISLNTAVFVGYSMRGYAGAAAAILGVILPSFIIMLVIALYLADLRTNRYVDAAFKGMRPAVVALIAAPIINLARGLGIWKIAAALVAAALVWYFGISPMWFIAAGAVAGIAYAFFNKKGMPDRATIQDPASPVTRENGLEEKGAASKPTRARNDGGGHAGAQRPITKTRGSTTTNKADVETTGKPPRNAKRGTKAKDSATAEKTAAHPKTSESDADSGTSGKRGRENNRSGRSNAGGSKTSVRREPGMEAKESVTKEKADGETTGKPPRNAKSGTKKGGGQ